MEIPYAFIAGYHDFEVEVNQFEMIRIAKDPWDPLNLTVLNTFQWYGRDLIH